MCSEAQAFSFLFPCREDHVIRTAVTKLGGGRPMRLDVTSIALAHYLNQSLISPRKTGKRKEKLTISFVPSCIDTVQRFSDDIGGWWLQLHPRSSAQFIGGIFTYNWGSFHLACQKAQQRRRAPRGSYHFPYFLAPDKGIQAGSLLKMMYF